MRHCTRCSKNPPKPSEKQTKTPPAVSVTNQAAPDTMLSPSPSSRHRRWLIVAHCFNMDGRAASQTITDRIPYLLEHHIQPVVLSAPTGIKDYRFPHRQTLSIFPSGLLFELRQVIEKKTEHSLAQQCLKTLLTVTLSPFVFVEKIFIRLDSHWSWFITAFLHGKRLIKRFQPELIYSTGGPSSAHLAGYLLHRCTGLPWLAELHDPLCYGQRPRRIQKNLFQWWLETIIAHHANAVFFFTVQAMNSAIQRHPALATKANVLRPGANPPDFSSVTYEKTKHFNIAHFGSLSPARNLKTVFEALIILFETKPEWRKHIRLHVYGSSVLDTISAISLKSCNLDDIVIQHGRLEYDPLTQKSGRQQIVETMRQTDLLLLLHGEGLGVQEYIPSKFYEYLLTKRPVLGLASPESELGKMLFATGHSCVDGNTPADVANQLDQLLNTWRTNGLPDFSPAICFTVQHAVEQLVQTAKNITQDISCPPATTRASPPFLSHTNHTRISRPYLTTTYGHYVLHVKKGYERRKTSILRQFSLLGIPVQWVLEHDIPEITAEILHEHRYKGSLRKEEISCCLKHIAAWKHIAESTYLGGFVFEDDVVIDLENFAPVIQEALDQFHAAYPDGNGYISLGDGCALYVPWTKKRKGKRLYTAIHARAADSYWLSKGTAHRMVAWVMQNGFGRPADHLIDQICGDLDIPIFWLEPSIASQGSHTGLFCSSIQLQERCNKIYKKAEWLFKKTRRKYLYPLLNIDLTKR